MCTVYMLVYVCVYVCVRVCVCVCMRVICTCTSVAFVYYVAVTISLYAPPLSPLLTPPGEYKDGQEWFMTREVQDVRVVSMSGCDRVVCV